MQVGVPRELAAAERRVAVAPDTVPRLVKLGFTVAVEAGAGDAAGFTDQAYVDAGATLVDREAAWGSDIVAHIEPPGVRPDGQAEVDDLRAGAILVSMLDAARNGDLLAAIAARGASAVALERVPRITRAQKMDVLSSMANIAGYRAVIEAANIYGSFFTAQMTAAGKAPPCRVLVIGAGVAGLAAMGAARALGAEVRAFDVRPACREQVESMGGQFLEVQIEESGEGGGGYAKTMSPEFIAAEMALFLKQAKQVDVIITTALIPGKRAPTLITADHIAAMKPGSVVVDMAAATGGNCELSQAGKAVVKNGVTIIGYTDLASRMAPVSSRFFGQNIAHLLDDMGGGEDMKIDLEDQVLHQTAVVYNGAVRWPIEPFPTAAPPPRPTPAAAPAVIPATAAAKVPPKPSKAPAILSLVAAVILVILAFTAPGDFLQHLTVFVLAVFVGWQLIWNVSPALHTPLMSVTNAISGIIILGGLLQAGTGKEINLSVILGAVAILFASINVAGGFLVTQRMLRMFHK
ncbi:MAG: Re/Si-specific NAD(P)(+) transhydrogenase subunit alpha [Oligoflexia bacterium]|nr:Re/Si-specific NAD(P)(+) transhydrogenase subunit alpha [Oligoflexia bacterium]